MSAWWTPSPFRRQWRRTFHPFIRAKACFTRARTLRWEALCSYFQAGARPGLSAGGAG
jgi:hypothetical protein